MMVSTSTNNIAFQISTPLSGHIQTRGGRPSVAKCSIEQADKEPARKPFHRKRKRPVLRASANARPISDVSVGDQFVGTVCEVGPAESSWIEIGVATLSGKAVRARLRLADGEKEKDKSDAIGGIIPVYVQKLNRPAARIEVRRGAPPVSREESLLQDARMLHSLQAGERLSGRVIALGAYGAVVDVNVLRNGKRGRVVSNPGLLPRKMFRKEWASDVDRIRRAGVQRVIAVGDSLDVWVRAVHTKNAFLLLDSVQLNLEQLEQEKRDKQRRSKRNRRRQLPNALEVGEQRVGKVREVARFGLFIDIGVRTDGLIHYTEMGPKHSGDWKETLGVETKVNVEVLSVSGNRIALRLISLPGEEEEEILSRAMSPTARFADVASAEVLESRKQFGDKKAREQVVGARDLSTHTNETRVVQHSEHVSKVVKEDSWYKEMDGREEDTQEDERKEDEDVEKFTDEYFEDKYGY